MSVDEVLRRVRELNGLDHRTSADWSELLELMGECNSLFDEIFVDWSRDEEELRKLRESGSELMALHEELRVLRELAELADEVELDHAKDLIRLSKMEDLLKEWRKLRESGKEAQ